MARKSAAFPVGLYGMLLFALSWLTLPMLFAPLERWLVGSACLLPRLASSWLGEPAKAESKAALQLISKMGVELQQRVQDQAFVGTGFFAQAAAAAEAAGAAASAHEQEAADALLMELAQSQQVLCTVRSVRRRGGGGAPSELLLEQTYLELVGCKRLVTKGSALVGFLLQPGQPGAARDSWHDPARIMLANHRYAPRLFAALELRDRERLRFVVRPASIADPAPLVVDLWDEPYRAARLRKGGEPVRTLALGENGVPTGLLLGRTLVWGYESESRDAPALPIGVFLEPAVAAEALSHVVLWRPLQPVEPPPGARQAMREGPTGRQARVRAQRVSATTFELPGVSHGRHLLVTPAAVPDGAAVVQDGLFLGSASGLRFGASLMTSFGTSQRPWSLLFLPRHPGAEPVELRARVEATSAPRDSERGLVRLRWQGPREGQSPVRGRGDLFTGSNGAFCPAGLWIGRASADDYESDLMHVELPGSRGPRHVEVFVAVEEDR
ncbi:MAG: hypothetical protein AB8H80_19115 [Planctomycetota bacterium]